MDRPVLRADEYLSARHVPPVRWLIHRVIPAGGLILLVGPPKAGKSFLALQVALAVAQGQPFLGQPCAEARPVLYLQLDTPAALWQQRLADLAASGVDLSGPLWFPDPASQPVSASILVPEGREWVRSVVEACDPDLVVIDTLREAHGADEDSSTSMKAVMDALRTAVGRRAVLVVHHNRKPGLEGGADDPVQASRGSTYLTGRMDAVWLLRRLPSPRDGVRHELRVASRYDVDLTYRAVQTESGLWRFPDTESREQRAQALLGLCAEFAALSHEEVWRIARDRHLVESRAEWVRLTEGRACAHR